MRRLNAYTVYLILACVSAMVMGARDIAMALYFVREVGMNPFQLVFAGTVFMIAVVLCEVPTGVVADVYSRRLSVIIGVFVVGSALLLEGLVPAYGPILVAQVLWGIGLTFNRGALEAWIADELGDRRDLGQVLLRGAQAGYVGALLGIGLGVLLASVRLNLPSATGGVLFLVLGGFLSLAMPETGFTRVSRAGRRSWQVAADTLREGLRLVRHSTVLPIVMGIVFFLGMSSETYDRLWEVHFLRNFQPFPGGAGWSPIVWFGIIGVGGLVLSILTAEVAQRRLDTATHLGAVRVLLGIDLALLLSMVAFGLAGNFGVALAAYWLAYLLRRTNQPLFTAWLNQSLQPRVRATVISLAGQVDAVGQIAGGPAFGLLATAAGTRSAMVAAGLVLAPAAWLYVRALRRRVDAVEPVLDPAGAVQQ
ncbi:MAG: MFS transporter [Chloroflexota bacterium]|nr:MFS transporter [Chloroflexota bacterium]